MTCVLLIPTGCKRRRHVPGANTADDGALASMVNVADPRTSLQLVKGFYSLENNSWRWTAGSFAVTLKPPRNAVQNGARLVLKFVIPDVVMQQLHSINLSAKVSGIDVPPEDFTQAGQYTYSRDVPASALTSDAVNVDFTLDKYLPPSSSDKRELGVIVSAAGFEAK